MYGHAKNTMIIYFFCPPLCRFLFHVALILVVQLLKNLGVMVPLHLSLFPYPEWRRLKGRHCTPLRLTRRPEGFQHFKLQLSLYLDAFLREVHQNHRCHHCCHCRKSSDCSRAFPFHIQHSKLRDHMLPMLEPSPTTRASSPHSLPLQPLE